MQEQLLDVRHLRVDYQVRRQRQSAAIEDVTFQMAPAEIVGIVGESGCGKTTLALAVAGLLPENASVVSGTALFRGRDLLRLTEPEFEKLRGVQLALLSQEPAAALNPVIRVGDQVTEIIRVHRKWDRPRCRAAARSLLEELKLGNIDRIHKAFPHELSGGQRQRAALAVALACRPSLLIADEPTTSLDASTQEQILGALRHLQSSFGLAVLMITHDVAALAGFADRVMVMHEGRVVEDGRISEVCRTPVHPYTESLLSSVRRLSRPRHDHR